MSDKRFEQLSHVVYGGAKIDLPLLIHPELGLDDDSVALLHAADIIGGNPKLYEGDIHTLLDEVGMVVAQESGHEGVIIEDELGAGSISIGRESTIVTIDSIGKHYEISSKLVFDMLFAWANEKYSA